MKGEKEGDEGRIEFFCGNCEHLLVNECDLMKECWANGFYHFQKKVEK